MKNQGNLWMAALLGSLALTPFTTRAFDSGSTGTNGALLVTNTLTPTIVPLPSDGVFNYTTITVNSNCTLKFTPNGLNTPVYLLAQSDIVINGTIDVSGQDGQTNGYTTIPGPGGFSGGAAGTPTTNPVIPPGRGQGPGGGLVPSASGGSGGSFGTAGFGNNSTYGNLLLVPMLGGSGGAGMLGNATLAGASGGAGGGGILLASSTSVAVNGLVQARGGRSVVAFGSSGGGSGGGVRLVAPTISVAGAIDVSGGTNNYFNPAGGGDNGLGGLSYGGNGRVRIDAATPLGFNPKVIGNTRAGAPIVSYGHSLFVFPPNRPQLYFVNAAGTPIPAGTNNAVYISLPAGSSTNQTVTLRGTNFLGTLPVTIIATPATGPVFSTNIVLNFPALNALVETNVIITVAPFNNACQLNAYAKYGVSP